MGDRRQTVAIFGKIADAGTKRLAEHGGFKIVERDDHAADRYAVAEDADAIIVRMTAIDRELLGAAPRLRFVARHGVGYDTVDVDALTERGIPLAVTGDVNSGAVAEHTMMLMLVMAKKTVPYDQAVRRGEFAVRDSFSAIELGGRTVLLVGFGRIGRKVADLCNAFGMSVIIFDPFLRQSAVRGTPFRLVQKLADGLKDADFVTVHAPLTPQTRHIVDGAAIESMKPGAHLINVARGGLVDETALQAALQSGRLSGAALDVFEDEPPQATNPLLENPNTVFSPHCAAFTVECGDRMAIACAENVIGFFGDTLDTDLVINRGALPQGAVAGRNDA